LKKLCLLTARHRENTARKFFVTKKVRKIKKSRAQKGGIYPFPPVFTGIAGENKRV